jgi:predicted nuclease with TOPRIM domain
LAERLDDVKRLSLAEGDLRANLDAASRRIVALESKACDAASTAMRMEAERDEAAQRARTVEEEILRLRSESAASIEARHALEASTKRLRQQHDELYQALEAEQANKAAAVGRASTAEAQLEQVQKDEVAKKNVF